MLRVSDLRVPFDQNIAFTFFFSRIKHLFPFIFNNYVVFSPVFRWIESHLSFGFVDCTALVFSLSTLSFKDHALFSIFHLLIVFSRPLKQFIF
jgi:hypothetical protein